MVSLLSILTFVILIVAFLNYWQIDRQNQHIFDAQLITAAQVLDALTSANLINQTPENFDRFFRRSEKTTLAVYENSPAELNFYTKYQNMLVFQVWNTSTHQILLKSSEAPNYPLATTDYGFEQLKDFKGDSWYSYSLSNTSNNTKVIMAVRSQVYHQINLRLFLHDFSILLVVYLIISLLIVWTVKTSLRPLTRAALEVSTRNADNLAPLNLKNMPAEIRPLLKELNRLFRRLLETLNREKRFTADAAHELRTPLAALKTQVEVARREEDPERRSKILNNMILGSNRCAHVIEQLLTLSRLEPEATLSDQVPISLTAVAEQLVGELAPLAIEKDIEIELQAPTEPIYILGNSISIGILLRNLIDNAIRYTPNGGLVSVIISETRRNVILQVIDSGPGIPKELRERIFDRFFRELGNQTEGSGLGLSIVKQIVRLHHGTIEAKTPKSNKGLEMCVRFPSLKAS
ncbi:MAG: two-component sensor histidine kinase [Gammaproteobacteria bacterium]|nr:two-component sensor histidine kinase [Gammaproteobacteria bacterium]